MVLSDTGISQPAVKRTPGSLLTAPDPVSTVTGCSLVPDFMGLHKQQKTQYIFFNAWKTLLLWRRPMTQSAMKWKDPRTQKSSPQKMALRTSFSQENYWPWITQKRAGKGQEEYYFCSHTRFLREKLSQGVLTFSFSWYRIGLRTEKGCSTAVLHEHVVQDSLKSQDTAAANSLSCLFIIEETHSSKFCVGFSVTRSFLVVTASQLWSQHSHYYRSLFWKGKELTLKTKNWRGK